MLVHPEAACTTRVRDDVDTGNSLTSEPVQMTKHHTGAFNEHKYNLRKNCWY